MLVSDNRWIKDAWKKEARKESNSVKDEIILTIQAKGKIVKFEGVDMREFKAIWK